MSLVGPELPVPVLWLQSFWAVVQLLSYAVQYVGIFALLHRMIIDLDAFFYSNYVDPWHFDTVSDRDLWIRTTDLQIPIRIRILLFSSVADKMPTKNYFFPKDTFTSAFIDKKKKRCHNVVSRVFLLFCLLMELLVSGSVQNNDGSVSGRLKNIRIRIHNTA